MGYKRQKDNKFSTIRDNKLTDAFGGESQIITNNSDYIIDAILSSMNAEYNYGNDLVHNLFWDHIAMDTPGKFKSNGISYDYTIKNVWLELEGLLDETFINSNSKSNDVYDTISDEFKMFKLLSEKQVALSSSDLANTLKLRSDEYPKDLEKFRELLEIDFNKLVVISDNKDVLDRIFFQLNASLSNFLFEKIDDATLKMIRLDIESILSNAKNMGSIEKYYIYTEENINIQLYFKDSEYSVTFNISICDELKIEVEK